MSTAETTEPQAPTVPEPDETPDETPDEDAPEDAPEPIEGDDDDEGTPVPGERLDDGGTGDDAASQAALSEKEIEKRLDSIHKENERHRKRVSEILEEDALALIPCPVCMEFPHGWIYPPERVPLDEGQEQRMMELLGLMGTEGLKQAPFAERCPVCDGRGEVATGSLVAGYETTSCERCKKNGWVRVGDPTMTGPLAVEYPPAEVAQPEVNGATSDPEVQHLRERGFTVIPPLAMPQG